MSGHTADDGAYRAVAALCATSTWQGPPGEDQHAQQDPRPAVRLPCVLQGWSLLTTTVLLLAGRCCDPGVRGRPLRPRRAGTGRRGAGHRVPGRPDHCRHAGSGHTVQADWAGLTLAGASNPTGVPGMQIDGYFRDTSTSNTTTAGTTTRSSCSGCRTAGTASWSSPARPASGSSTRTTTSSATGCSRGLRVRRDRQGQHRRGSSTATARGPATRWPSGTRASPS